MCLYLNNQQENKLNKLVKTSAIIIILGAMLSGPIGTGLGILSVKDKRADVIKIIDRMRVYDPKILNDVI